jgi:hypothetical protein
MSTDFFRTPPLSNPPPPILLSALLFRKKTMKDDIVYYFPHCLEKLKIDTFVVQCKFSKICIGNFGQCCQFSSDYDHRPLYKTRSLSETFLNVVLFQR